MTDSEIDALHIYPIEDWIDHKTDGPGCVCCPAYQITRSDNGRVVVVVLHKMVRPVDKPLGFFSRVRRFFLWLWDGRA